MKAKTLSIILVCASLLFGCKPSIEEGLSYDQNIGKAELALKKSEVEKAILYYKKALKLRPSDANTHYVLGEIYDREYKASYQAAVKKHLFQLMTHPETGSKFNKADPNVLEKYGLKLGYDEKAIQEFREAIKYDGKFWQARYYIAADHFNKKHFQEAIEELKKVIQLNPEYSNSYSILGQAYMEIGSLDLAVDTLNAAIKLHSGFDDYDYYQLALVYRKMNKGDKVGEIFKMLKETKSPMFDELRLALYNHE